MGVSGWFPPSLTTSVLHFCLTAARRLLATHPYTYRNRRGTHRSESHTRSLYHGSLRVSLLKPCPCVQLRTNAPTATPSLDAARTYAARPRPARRPPAAARPLPACRPHARTDARTPAQSFCGNATTLDKISFSLFDDEGRRQSYLGGAYMLTKEGTRTIRTNLTGERAATGMHRSDAGCTAAGVSQRGWLAPHLPYPCFVAGGSPPAVVCAADCCLIWLLRRPILPSTPHPSAHARRAR